MLRLYGVDGRYTNTNMVHSRNDTGSGKPKYSRRNCPSSTLSTTNPMFTDLGSKFGIRV